MILDKFKLDGKVAIVTGSSTGIGRAIAMGLAEAGADLAVVARNETLLEELAQEVQALGRRCLPVKTDLSKVAEIKAMVAKVKDHYGKIDILVNNAGVNKRKATLDIDENDWNIQMDVNVKGTYFVSQEVAKIMKEQRSGNIISITSNVAVVGLPGQVMYCMGKGSICQMTKAMAIDLVDYNIRVNALGPGLTRTPLTEKIFKTPDMLNYRLGRIPMHRVA